MLLQAHMLKSYAVTSLNRDRDGEAKWVDFGGYRRARISSQCIKRTIRMSPQFRQYVDDAVSMRTRLLPAEVGAALDRLGASSSETKAIIAAVREFGKGDKPKASADGPKENLSEDQTNQVLAFSSREAAHIAEMALAALRDDGEIKAGKIAEISPINGGPEAADLALFGRMSTGNALSTIKAACSVAHAISTNHCPQMKDFFTAVDDISGQTGSAHMGDISFSAPIHYFYFAVDIELLIGNLNGNKTLAHDSILGMVSAMMHTSPSARQSSMASFPTPSFLLLELSKNMTPVSYTNAFMNPVDRLGIPVSTGLDGVARNALLDHMHRIDYQFDIERDTRIMFPDSETPTVGVLMERLADALN